MAGPIPFCNTPWQSLAVGVAAGLLGGLVGLAAGLEPPVVAVLAGALGLLGDVGGHVVRGDAQFRDATAGLRGRNGG